MPPELDKLRISRTDAELSSPSRRRWLILILAGMILTAVTLLYLLGFLTPAVEVTVTPATRVFPSQAYTLLNASGYVVAQRKAAVSSKSTGRLSYLNVEEGSRVKKGQIMASLENEDLVAARNQAQAQISEAQAGVAQAQAELREASLQYDRYKTLVAQDLVSRQDFDAVLARYQKAQAGLAGAQARLHASRQALANAQAALEYSYIRSPFDGVVLTKNAEVGEVVAPFGAAATAKGSVVTMADMASLMVEADVAEANLDRVHQGQPCEITLDAIPDRRFPGEVHMIVPTADRAKATVMTKVKFLALDDRILPEMSAKVAFLSRPLTAADTQPRLAIPKSALLTQNGRAFVYRLEHNRLKLTPVSTGTDLGELVEIVAGLKEGDRVALRPSHTWTDGTRIKVKNGP